MHWKRGHKRACTATVAAEARRMTAVRKAREAREGGGVLNEECVICMGAVVEPVELPCGHLMCTDCTRRGDLVESDQTLQNLALSPIRAPES